MATGKLLTKLTPLLLLVLSTIPKTIETAKVRVCKRVDQQTTTRTTNEATTTEAPTTTTEAPTTTTEAPTTTAGCSYSTYSGGHKLKVYSTTMDQTAAKQNCEADGAQLVVIKDTTVNQAINQALLAEGLSMSTDFWMGLEFEESPSVWKWVDNTTLAVDATTGAADDGISYTNWWLADSHLGTGAKACVYNLYSARKWNKESCGSLRKSVCQCPE